MVQFHETGYGARFFNGQLPALIEALERMAKAVEKLVEKKEGGGDVGKVESASGEKRSV